MKMAPNEWGDFLAGAFAPLAFLWLVLGYLQQGDELRMSTEALRLQALELRNSVDQQRELVEVSRLQVEGEREALAYERRLREELSRPKFSVNGSGGVFRGDGDSTYNLFIANAGHEATGFVARVRLHGSAWRDLMAHAVFAKGASYGTSISTPVPLQNGDSLLELRYIDGIGNGVEETFRIEREFDHPHAGLKFLRVEA